MSTYTIGDVVERTGFSATTLRYYEHIGLVAPAGRTDSGYRLYDDDSLAVLRLVGQAKDLGCTLDEIGDLVALVSGERCEPVQRRLHELVTAKIDEAERRIAELRALADRLREAATRLDVPPVDGPCDAGCACNTLTTSRVVLGRRAGR